MPENLMCVPCQLEGGWRVTLTSPLLPPAEAVAPYTGRQNFTDDAGNRVAEAWPYEPMCPHHACRTVEAYWRKRHQRVAADRAAGKNPPRDADHHIDPTYPYAERPALMEQQHPILRRKNP